MTDWAAIATRFGLYLDLMLLFGLAAYPLYAIRAAPLANQRAIIFGLSIAGLVLSIASFGVMAAAMAGVAVTGLDGETLRVLLLETAPGSAFIARNVALVAAAAFALGRSPLPLAWLIALCAGIALASLAWTGHAAVTEGVPGTLHRVADIVHLLAAAAWIGALVALLDTLAQALDDDNALAAARRALSGFAWAGSLLVALVIATGVVNGGMILGWQGLGLLPATLYGQLLIAKLTLLAAMLGLAAANRWRLAPRLDAARNAGDIAVAARIVRTSIAVEAAAATLILGLVAWLGTLDPTGGI